MKKATKEYTDRITTRTNTRPGQTQEQTQDGVNILKGKQGTAVIGQVNGPTGVCAKQEGRTRQNIKTEAGTWGRGMTGNPNINKNHMYM